MPNHPPRLGASAHLRIRIIAGFVVFAIGLVATLFISRWAADDARRDQVQALEQDGRALVQSVRNALSRVESRVAAVTGFLRFFDDVTQEEFEQFVGELGLLDGLGGFGYAPLVKSEDLDDYRYRMTLWNPGYEVFGVDETGVRIPLGTRAWYFPIEVFAPPEAFGTSPLGLDLMSEPHRRAAVQEARRSHMISVTPLLQVFGEAAADGIVVVGPVMGDDGTVRGVVTAPIDVDMLLASQVPAELRDIFTWEITNLTDIDGATDLDTSDVVWEDLVSVGPRVWRVRIAAIETPGTGGLFNLQLSVPVGLTGSLMSALLVVLWLQRSQVKSERTRSRTDATAKDRFLASVSHELRTPLTSVIGFLNQAMEPVGSTDPAIQDMLAIAYDQAVEMEQIVEDLLVVARIDEMIPTARSRSFEVSEEVAHVVAGFSRPVQATIQLAGEAVAYADTSRTRQILRNLVANAATHGAPPIDISIASDRDCVRIQVRDHGKGVARHNHDRLFEPYAAFDQSVSVPDSLGIGLWLSRRLARLMGGNLTYSHTEAGPVFELSLPAADAEPHVPRKGWHRRSLVAASTVKADST